MHLFHVLQWCIALWAAIPVMQRTDFFCYFFFFIIIMSQARIQVSKSFEYLLVFT